MRKPRDFDAELKTLADKAKHLQQQKLHQLGELVAATGADSLSPEHLAGALLAAIEIKDAPTKEAWRKRGAAFFQSKSRKNSGANAQESGGTSARAGGAASPASADGASG